MGLILYKAPARSLALANTKIVPGSTGAHEVVIAIHTQKITCLRLLFKKYDADNSTRKQFGDINNSGKC